MITNEYRVNRHRMLSETLEPHRGKWAAFSADGAKIVASEPTLEMLEETLKSRGVDAQTVAFEWVPGDDDDDSWLGASEWQ